ncbi:vacuolar protein sorting-associated protein 41 [Heliocybe sulcata]|uniref:Vacuolar protein sorting-associated protein 41 n=1 Tax=Heliocybe sulcata TaxID=5364 RepID=A0A5C3MZR1_9AGAM|nr:vacuolar protein sorting-associated protein 41 [Heliocybe sulcata]
MKRPMRTVNMEPGFAKKSTRAFVCGGMAGSLVLHEKGWLGHKETVLHTGEGPIWSVRWRDRLIAWANDLGVKIYDTLSQSRITFIDRPPDSPRADLFKSTLHWQDNSTLLIAWADHIKVARVRARPRTANSPANLPPLLVEITAVFKLDCMIAGIVPHPLASPTCAIHPSVNTSAPHSRPASVSGRSTPSTHNTAASAPLASPALTTFLVLAYTTPDTSFLTEVTEDRAQQKRQAAERPELRIISRAGEELSADLLSIQGFEKWTCNDYVLAAIDEGGSEGYVVLSPKDLVVVKPRDKRDHIAWLVERERYEEALDEMEHLGADEAGQGEGEGTINAAEIGQRYIEHLVAEGNFAKAAKLCPKVCGQDAKRWEDWIFVFAQKRQMQTIIPYVPTESPKLGHLVYEMVLAYFLTHDRHALLQTIKTWPKGIYDISAVIVAVQSELDKAPSTSTTARTAPEAAILMECLAELYTMNRQPGKALPYFLRLRRPNVFDLIREHNLFTAVQDQVLLLVEFDQEVMENRRKEGQDVDDSQSAAIQLLVDHTHSIPIGRVVQQLQGRPYYLFLYLDALFKRDPYLASDFADSQVKLCAEYAPPRLIDFLRASNYYSLERAYNVCKERDLVPEMVFLLGRMGNNKQALTLIIERLGDVNRAIDFAKEQNDDDLWEDLLKYSETRPTFIRGLLENVGAEIDPIRLIRRIKNGLEIPGLKEALIKILHDFNLQISLLDGCQTILEGDCTDFARRLQRDQSSGYFLAGKTLCPICSKPLQRFPQSLVLLFLCRHVVHASCCSGGDNLPHQPGHGLAGLGLTGGRSLSGKIAFTAVVRAKIEQGCPVCHKKDEGDRT